MKAQPILQAEESAALALVQLAEVAYAAKDALLFRTTINALSILVSDWQRTSTDTEANTLPPADLAALRTSTLDRYALVAFIAEHPNLAEQQGMRLTWYSDPMTRAIETITSWRSPERIAEDEARMAKYRAEQAAKEAATTTTGDN